MRKWSVVLLGVGLVLFGLAFLQHQKYQKTRPERFMINAEGTAVSMLLYGPEVKKADASKLGRNVLIAGAVLFTVCGVLCFFGTSLKERLSGWRSWAVKHKISIYISVVMGLSLLIVGSNVFSCIRSYKDIFSSAGNAIPMLVDIVLYSAIVLASFIRRPWMRWTLIVFYGLGLLTYVLGIFSWVFLLHRPATGGLVFSFALRLACLVMVLLWPARRYFSCEGDFQKKLGP